MELTVEQTVKLSMLTPEDVLQVYSGQNGKCCCGCAGTHTYNPLYKDIASEYRGYEVDDDECNEKVVKRILNKVKKNLANIEYFEDDFVSVVIGKRPSESYRTRAGRQKWLEHPGRLYVVYFKPTQKEIEEHRQLKALWKADAEAKKAADEKEKILAQQGAGI